MGFRRHAETLWFAFGLILMVPHCFAQSEEQVTVRFVVSVNETFTSEQTLFLAGNHVHLGNWKPDGLQLVRQSTGDYLAEVEFPAGSEIEFKITQGDWSTVEKSRVGQDIQNRKLKVKPDQVHGDQSKSMFQEAKVHVLAFGRGSGKPSQKGKSTVHGDLVIHEADQTKPNGLDRRIAVWLPPQYAQNPDGRFPVLYMHDGQNLFDSATAAFGAEWQIDETASRLIDTGKIEPLIIVGIWNTKDRINEYTPVLPPSNGSSAESTAIDIKREGGDRYLDYLVSTIKPMVDHQYRTKSEREFTAIGGSSLGGLISLYAAVNHDKVFSRYAAISPSLGWNDEQLLKRLEQDQKLADQFKHSRVWIDMGTREGSTAVNQEANVKRTQRLVKVMNGVGLDSDDEIKHLIIPDGHHNERAWSERFGAVLEFLFPVDKNGKR